jgi:hypothetical protein
MDKETHALTEHVHMLYKAIRSLHIVLAHSMLMARAVRLTFDSLPQVEGEYARHLAEPLSKEEQESLDRPLQALNLMIANFERQFGPTKPSDVN